MNDVVIVGNGPSVLQYEMGAEIDAHKCVCRLNEFETAGYEKHVGTKTDAYFVAAATPRQHDFKKFEAVAVLTGRTRFASYKKQAHELTFPWLYYQQSAAIMASMGSKKSFTMGAAAIWWFFAQNVKVDIIGFDFFQTAGPLHYYGTGSAGAYPVTHAHDPLREKRWIDGLVQIGMVCPLTPWKMQEAAA